MNILKQLRTEHGLNMTQMAKRLDIAKSYYSMLESGTRDISKSIAIKIHREFRVPLDILLLSKPVHSCETKEASTNV